MMRITRNCNRRQNIATFFLALLLFSCTFVTLVKAQENAGQQTGKKCLWRIKTANNTVYLLGSIHVFKKDSYPLARKIESAYKNSQKIIFETNLDEMNSPAAQARMMSLAGFPEGQTLRQNISPKTYRLFTEQLTASGLPAARFERLRPWMCALTITMVEFQKFGFDARYGIDAYFFEKAKQDAKQILALESFEYQLNLFAGMEKGGQEAFLRQTLHDIAIIGEMSAAMEEAWQKGDTGALATLLKTGFEDYPDMYDRFIAERNKNWIPRIENLLRSKGNALVIVGAGHLVGEESVVDILRKKSFTVIQQ